MTDANTELQDMMRRAQRVEWITARVLEGEGSVEFCRTEDGRIGVFMRQEPTCRGIGATAGEAIDNAIHTHCEPDSAPSELTEYDRGETGPMSRPDVSASVVACRSEVAALRAFIQSLDGAAITRDLAGIKGEADYIHRRDTDQRITYTIVDADAVLLGGAVR